MSLIRESTRLVRRWAKLIDVPTKLGGSRMKLIGGST
jgi:hypothetical protein